MTYFFKEMVYGFLFVATTKDLSLSTIMSNNSPIDIGNSWRGLVLRFLKNFCFVDFFMNLLFFYLFLPKRCSLKRCSFYVLRVKDIKKDNL